MPATTDLLERESELETIGELLDATGAGNGGLLSIEGEAGAGKTVLLEAASAAAGERGLRVLRARGGEFERDFPHGVMRQLFEPLLADAASRERLLSGSAKLAAPVFDLADAAQEGNPLAVQHGLYWLTADIAADTPTLLLVDDAQWADAASLQTLVYIGRRIEGLPALLCLTVRSGEPGGHERYLNELRAEPSAKTLRPAPLSAAGAGRLVAAEAGCEPSEDFAASCREATAGNPFLLVQLLRALDGEREIEAERGAGDLAELAADGVARSILVRLDRLGEEAGSVARAVAVLEPNATPALLSELTGLDPGAIAAASELLVRARLLTDTQPVSFVHPLVREAVLSEVPAPRRGAEHAGAARLLDRAGADADSIAAHLLLAEPSGDEWATSALRRAAAKALERGAPAAAVRYLRRALLEPPAKEERPGASRELGLALLRANDPEGIEVLRTVRATTEDPVTRAELAAEMTSSLGLRGGNEEAVAMLEESLAALPDASGELATTLRGWLLLQTLWGRERLPADAMPAPGEEPSPETLAGRMVLGQAAHLNAIGLGTVDRGLELAEMTIPDLEIVVADTTDGMPPLSAMAAIGLAGRGESVTHLFSPIIEAAARRGAPPSVAAGYGVRAFLHLLAGNVREGQADADVAVNIVRDTGLTGSLAICSGLALRACAARGDIDAGEALLDRYWREYEPISGLPCAILFGARGELRRAAGRYAEARHDYLACAERIRFVPQPNHEIAPWRAGLALCEAALGNAEEALAIARESTALARRARGVRGLGIALRVEGSVTAGEAGIALLREAVATLAPTDARYEHAQTLVELGATLRRANRRKEAREPLRQGLDLAHRCGTVPLEERARTELAATGARPRKAFYSGVESLTPSELRVARLAAEGRTNREIAQSLTVTEKTIETHMRHVFQKLDVGRRTELASALASS
ncbi:MAG TPA: AAA family ATPase [Solirubrobacterales bacterium]|nr:AAA family ATPase [Solirubrobacterales bacterium]